MRWLANTIMEQRARDLFLRISPYLPAVGTIGDVGSGTGHNAAQIRFQTALNVSEFDVADLHWVGPGPMRISDDCIPASDRSLESVLLLFVLQYPEHVSRVLDEARRITRGSVIVLQSTCTGPLGRFALQIREFVWGRMAFRIAVRLRLVKPVDCPLQPHRYLSRRELLEAFQQAGFVVKEFQQSSWPLVNVSRDLFVLEPVAL